MSAPIVLFFQDYRKQAEEFAAKLTVACLPVSTHYFPDGEVRINIPEKLPEKIIVFRSLDSPNNKLIELLLVAETARTLGVKHITLIAPYLCYMRQDIAFHAGDAISQRIVGSYLSRLFDRIITVDPHLHRINHLDEVMHESENVVLSASTIIGNYVAAHINDAILIGPDEESEQWVSSAAKSSSLKYYIATKQRHGDRDVDISLPDLNVSDKTLVLMDDVISTGHTLSKTANVLLGQGAKKIYCIATHVLLSETDMQNLLSAGVEAIFSTDSIDHVTNVISLSQLIADNYKKIVSRPLSVD